MMRLKKNSSKFLNRMDKAILSKLSFFLLPLPVIMLVTGVQGMITSYSPDNLGSISSLSHGFVDYINYNTMIISGALLFTFLIWLATRNLWK